MLAGLVVLQFALSLVEGTDFTCDLNTDEYGRPYYGPNDGPLNFIYAPPNLLLPPARPGNVTLLFTAKDDVQQYWRGVKSVCGPLLDSNECGVKPEACSGSRIAAQYNSRGLRCSCDNGVLVRCLRVRKEWHSLSPEERKHYTDTVVIASNRYQECFSALIDMHYSYFSGYGIHGGPDSFFLPWHRWYILKVENLLRHISPGITVPYWDWSLEAEKWKESIIWDPEFGFGGNGIPVKTGPFRVGGDYKLPDPTKPIGRFFNSRPHNCAYVASVQKADVDKYRDWYRDIENQLHDSMHCHIGSPHGTMCQRRSADDPIFFLHHAFIDKLWADWQFKGPEYLNLYHWARNNSLMPGESTPQQVYNLLQQPQCVGVSYQSPAIPCDLPIATSRGKSIQASIQTSIKTCSQTLMSREYSPLKLAEFISRSRPIPEPSKEAFKLFHTSPENQAIAKATIKLLNNYERLVEVLSENGYSTSTPLIDQVRGGLDLTSALYRSLYLDKQKCEL